MPFLNLIIMTEVVKIFAARMVSHETRKQSMRLSKVWYSGYTVAIQITRNISTPTIEMTVDAAG